MVAEEFCAAALRIIPILEWTLRDLQSWIGSRELFHFDSQDRLIIESCARASMLVDGVEDRLNQFL